jgi:Holliday junction resolvase RusA-like endonuclease
MGFNSRLLYKIEEEVSMDDDVWFWVDGKCNADKGKGQWFQAVATKAQEEITKHQGFHDPRASYIVEINFHFIRPKSVKSDQHLVKPDLTRLEITTLKALEHILFPDVKQVTEVHTRKVYTNKDGALISVHGKVR